MVSIKVTVILIVFYLVKIVAGQGDKCEYKAKNDDPSEIEMERLHKLAMQESRRLVVLEGGDEKDQLNFFNPNFQIKFPCINVTWTVDLSNIHDVKINEELKNKKAGEKLSFDVVTLQTVHDYYEWKDQGVLLKFRPVGSEHVPKEIKDPCGFFTGIKMVTFSHYAKKSTVNKPTRYEDYLKPEWEDNGKLILTYPQDDDAVLFQFHLAMKKDPKFVEKLHAQKPKWVRGTATPYTAINKNVSAYEATFTTSGLLNNESPFQAGQFTISPPDEEFLTWGQMSAIFKDAPNINTAKLWLTWWLSKEQQTAWTGFQWAARRDIKPPVAGTKMKHWSAYNNTSPQDFVTFMRNRKLVSEISQKIDPIIGKVQGVSPLEDKCTSEKCIIE